MVLFVLGNDSPGKTLCLCNVPQLNNPCTICYCTDSIFVSVCLWAMSNMSVFIYSCHSVFSQILIRSLLPCLYCSPSFSRFSNALLHFSCLNWACSCIKSRESFCLPTRIEPVLSCGITAVGHPQFRTPPSIYSLILIPYSFGFSDAPCVVCLRSARRLESASPRRPWLGQHAVCWQCNRQIRRTSDLGLG